MIVTIRLDHVKDRDDLLLQMVRAATVINNDDRNLEGMVRIPLSQRGVRRFGEIQVRNG